MMAYWYNSDDQNRLKEIESKDRTLLTEEEVEFLKDMWLQEKIAYECEVS